MATLLSRGLLLGTYVVLLAFHVDEAKGDTTPPVISDCPSTITLQVPQGSFTAIASWTPPTASDNEGPASIISNGNNPGASYPIGSTTVIYTATDQAGLKATCAFNILVSSEGGVIPVDGIPPVLTSCTNAVFAQLPPGADIAFVSWDLPTATDNGKPIDFVTGYTLTRGYFAEGIKIGPYIWIFSDAAQNTVSCRMYIYVAGDTV